MTPLTTFECHVGVTNASSKGVTLKSSMKYNILRYYLQKLTSLRWQTLEVISPHYKLPVGGIADKVATWRNKVTADRPERRCYAVSEMKIFLRLEHEEEETTTPREEEDDNYDNEEDDGENSEDDEEPFNL